MKKDIFAILKHEGHDIRIIEHNNNIVLGCADCGTTLYSFKDDFNAKDFLEIYNTIKNESIESLKKSMHDFVYKLVNKIRMGTMINSAIETLNTALDNSIKYNYTTCDLAYTFNATRLLSDAMTKTYGINSCDAFSILRVLDKDSMIEITKNISNELRKALDTNKFFILDFNEKVTYSCCTFSCDYEDIISVLFKELLEKAEKENPTPTNVIKVEDGELYSIIPSYDDEECREQKYLEYVYRMKNNLYDLSEVKNSTILAEILDLIGNWDYYYRYDLIGEALKQRMKSEEEKEKQ